MQNKEADKNLTFIIISMFSSKEKKSKKEKKKKENKLFIFKVLYNRSLINLLCLSIAAIMGRALGEMVVKLLSIPLRYQLNQNFFSFFFLAHH